MIDTSRDTGGFIGTKASLKRGGNGGFEVTLSGYRAGINRRSARGSFIWVFLRAGRSARAAKFGAATASMKSKTDTGAKKKEEDIKRG